MLSYVARDLVRNPRRTLASVAGIALAVGLFSGISLFVDSASSQMTARAIAPVTIDMQAGVNNPLASPLNLVETVSPSAAATGQVTTVTLTVTNHDSRTHTAVTIKETLPDQLHYVASTTTVRGTAIPDVAAGDSGAAVQPVVAGVAVGTLAPGSSAVVSYRATAVSDIPAASALPLAATAQSAEEPAPVSANASPSTDIHRVLTDIRAIPGVAGAEILAVADLPAGSLGLGSARVNAPVKVVGLDPAYLTTFPVVSITSGALRAGTAVLSQPAADLLGARPASPDPIALSLPGGAAPVSTAFAGVVDFSRATQLFVSRSPDTQGEFGGAPYIVVVDLPTFEHVVLPALRSDAVALNRRVSTPPVLEVDVRISRAVLATDPSSAAVTSQGLRRTIERVAPGEITAVDNLSDTLNAAKTDSILAKVLFIFLGLPGVLLAAYLSRYAGGLLAQAQRRERATLRARGIPPGALLRQLAYGTVAVALLGSALGLALSLGMVQLLFRDSSSLNVPVSSYLTAAGLAVAAAVITTAVALYIPGRRALMREVAEERREIESTAPPAWMRMRIDFALLIAAGLVGLVTFLTGGYQPAATAEAQSVSLAFYVLLAPLLLWIGATLLAVRVLLVIARRLAARRRVTDFRHALVRRTLMLSVLRRPQPIASGTIALSLAIAFGVCLTTFVGTYQAEKLADAHFLVGGDVRVTVGAQQTAAAHIGDQLKVSGVDLVTPLAQTTSVLVGTEKRSLVAVDPATFDQVAHTSPTFLAGMTPGQALSALAADPKAALIDEEIARTFNIQIGDPVRVQIPNKVTGKDVPFTFKAVATFTKWPGFPPGVDFVTSLATYVTISGAAAPDTYVLATDGSDATNAAVVEAIKRGPGKTAALLIDTTTTAASAEQSTLSALNLSGLGRLEIVYTLLMASLGVAIFVFGLILQRRGENVTMRALGMGTRQLLGIIAGEAGIVAVASLVIGIAVGLAMAVISVQILQPVFTIPPAGIAMQWSALGLFILLIAAATVLAAFIGGFAQRRAHLVEILREE
jgi:putative ABC transport system permease protein